jgi:Ca2+-binding RTX toxin-like protein
MNRRLLLGLTTVVVALAMTPILVGVGTAQQGNATYTFEECEEGWTTTEETGNPLATGWERSAPGDESGFAWHATDFPLAGSDASLVSPAHTSTGAEVTLEYRIAYSNFGEGLESVASEWSSDGTAWTTLETYEGASEGFVSEEQTFTPPAGPFQVRFRFFVTELGDGTATADVDNVVISRPKPAEATCASPSASASGSTSPSASGSPTGSPTASPTGSPTASPSPSGSPSPDPRGCTIPGTDGRDELEGTNGNDVICAGGGNDTVNGKGGNDTVYGDSGDDTLKGGGGNDNLKGGKGKDDLRGGKGDDKHSGGGGKDTCKDNKGNDRFKGCKRK